MPISRQFGPAPAEGAQADWEVEGAPKHWSVWLRPRPSEKNLSKTTVEAGAGQNGSKGAVLEEGQGGCFIHTLPVKVGERFLCSVWMRGVTSPDAKRAGFTDAAAAVNGSLLIRFRNADGLMPPPLKRSYTNQFFGVPVAGWQRLVLCVTAPETATGLCVMLFSLPLAEGHRVVFDNPVVQRLPAGAAVDANAGANLITNPCFEVLDGVGQAPVGWKIADWTPPEEKGAVSIEASPDARSGKVATRVRLTNPENVVLSPSLTRQVRGQHTFRLTCWHKLPRKGALYASVLTYGADGKRLQYLNSKTCTAAGDWAELAYEFTTGPAMRSLSLYLRPKADGILFDDVSLAW